MTQFLHRTPHPALLCTFNHLRDLKRLMWQTCCVSDCWSAGNSSLPLGTLWNFPPNSLDLHLVESLNSEPRMQTPEHIMSQTGHQDHRDAQGVALLLQKLSTCLRITSKSWWYVWHNPEQIQGSVLFWREPGYSRGWGGRGRLCSRWCSFTCQYSSVTSYSKSKIYQTVKIGQSVIKSTFPAKRSFLGGTSLC